MQVLGVVDFNQGQVCHGVVADDGGGEIAVVVESDFKAFGSVNHVVVGDDEAVGRDDDAGTEAHLLLARGFLAAGLHVAPGISEEILEERVVEEILPAVTLADSGETFHRYHTVYSRFGGFDELVLRERRGCCGSQGRCKHRDNRNDELLFHIK